MKHVQQVLVGLFRAVVEVAVFLFLVQIHAWLLVMLLTLLYIGVRVFRSRRNRSPRHAPGGDSRGEEHAS
jgi:hypothetical protein